MSNPWFRMYADFLSNPKVQILTEALRYRYVALLCLQCNGDYENRPDDEIALSLRVTVDEWISTRAEFVKRELLTPDFKIRGWEIKQYISDIKDPSAAERQKRYRERKRDARNAPVTSRLPEADTDTDTDIGSEGKPSSPKRARKVSPGIGIEDLTTDHIADWLAEKRMQGRYLAHDERFVLEQFRDYCRSKGKKYADYIAGYRNAFEWERCQPKVGGAALIGGNPNPSEKQRATAVYAGIIAERNAKANQGLP